MISISIILSVLILSILLLMKMIRMYGPQTGESLTVNSQYQIKDIKKRLGEFTIHNKIYLMKQQILDDLYDLIKYSDYILSKHKILYTTSHGTLLGAVRHKGIMPWDDDADLYIHVPYKNYNELILSLEKEMNKDGFSLLKNYNANYFHLCKTEAKHNFPYIDWFPGETDSDDIHPIKKIPFEDFEICVPNHSLKIIANTYNEDGKLDPLKNIVQGYPFSRYYSLWITQILKKNPTIHRLCDRIIKLFLKSK